MGSIRVLRTWEAHPSLRSTVQRELATALGIARDTGLCRVAEWAPGPLAEPGLLFEFRDHDALLAWSELPAVQHWSARVQALAMRVSQRVLGNDIAPAAVQSLVAG